MIGDLFDSPWKILIIVIAVLVLFGSAKLPVFARSLGKSMRILKKEVSALHDDDDDETAATPAASPIQAAPAAQLQATPAQDTQAQIDALSKQLAELQKANQTDSAQAK